MKRKIQFRIVAHCCFSSQVVVTEAMVVAGMQMMLSFRGCTYLHTLGLYGEGGDGLRNKKHTCTRPWSDGVGMRGNAKKKKGAESNKKGYKKRKAEKV